MADAVRVKVGAEGEVPVHADATAGQGNTRHHSTVARGEQGQQSVTEPDESRTRRERAFLRCLKLLWDCLSDDATIVQDCKKR